jgi:tRNA(Arg) A34 adenosine deaminase TadA
MSDTLPAATLTESDALYLGRAIAISNETRLRGNRPFGAVIVSAQGEVLAEGRNSNAETGDCTAHAETDALRIATPKFPREVLQGATMYASGEPCVMCAGAIFWGNIRRVVFAIDAVRLREFRAMQATASDLAMSCREVFAASPHAIEVIGPALIDEATAVHKAYWGR